MLAWWLDRVRLDVSSNDSWIVAEAEEAITELEEEPDTFLFKEYRFIFIEDHNHKAAKD